MPSRASGKGFATYELRTEPLLPRMLFYRRVAAHVAAAAALILLSVGVGVTGYMLTEHMSMLDAFLNSAMLLGGMGPVNTLTTTAGKLFAGLFALYCGLIFIVCAALVLTPLLHRLLHHFHVGDKT